MPSELRTERHDRTLVLTLSDPDTRNTLTEEIMTAGVEALNVAESSPDIRCIVLNGAGGHFCAGEASSPDARTEAHLERLHRLIETIRTFPKPVIAAVEGVAASTGFSLALSCDLVVASREARLDPASQTSGLPPDGGASWHLMQALPRALTLQMLWLGDLPTPQQLLVHGLINRVTEPGQALAEALSLGRRLATLPADTLARGKERLNHWPHSLHQQLDAERDGPG